MLAVVRLVSALPLEGEHAPTRPQLSGGVIVSTCIASANHSIVKALRMLEGAVDVPATEAKGQLVLRTGEPLCNSAGPRYYVTTVLAGLDPALDMYVELLANLPDELAQLTAQDTHLYSMLGEWEYGYMPQRTRCCVPILPLCCSDKALCPLSEKVGFLVAVARRGNERLEDIPTPPDFEFQYEAAEGWFFKNPRTLTLDKVGN